MDGASISVNAFETENVIITCDVTATNPVVASLTLTRPPANNVNFNESTGTITITDVTVDNAGTYTCTADNGVTTPTNMSFVLMVDSQPTSTTTQHVTDTASKLTFCIYKPLAHSQLLAG